VTRWGVYYGKKYTAWRKEVEAYLKENPPPTIAKFIKPVEIWIDHVVTKARTSKLEYPKPDLDNYDKAVMDAITSYTDVWTDDHLVINKHSTKRFATEETPAGAYITIEEFN